MKKLLLILLVFCTGTTLNYSQTLDANNSPANPGGGGFSVTPTQNVGQSYLAGLTGTLSQVNVYFQNISFSPGDFRLTIYSGDGYGGSVLGTQNFTISTLPPEGEYVIPISSTINVTAGNMYTMRLDGITGSCGFLAPGGSTGPYTNGVLYFGSSSPFTAYDLWFKTFITTSAPGTHLNFDGVNDRINCGNNTAIQITGANITLEARIRLTSFAGAPSDGNIINKEQNSPDNGYMLRVGGSGVINFNIGNSGWNELNSPSNAIQLDTWHHVAATYDGAVMKIFVDGVEVASKNTTFSIGNSSANLFIGDWPSGGRNLNGSIDEARIWNITRTTTQINDSKNCELQGTETGLMAYYKFNQGVAGGSNSTVTSATDSAGSNTGTLSGFALTGTTSNWLSGSTVVTGNTCAILNTSNFEISSKLKMYPNPTNSLVTIEVSDLTNVKLQILDITGKVLMNANLNTSLNSIDVSQFPTGMYMFKVTSNQGTSTSKVIKN